MKIITWNCNMVFRKKAGYILAHRPDILVVPECEHPDKLKFPDGIPLPTDVIWHGDNAHKGLGVFSYSDYRFKLLDCHNPAFKNILPIQVSNGKIDFLLFAVWANNPQDKEGAYVTQVWKAFHHYENLLAGKDSIWIGDFNSNTIWDKPRREGNHSALVKKLETHQVFSTYHTFHHQVQGQETDPTFFLYRHRDKSYHMDYCFASAALLQKLKQVEIGAYEHWSMYSDHKPLIAEFDL
ncbi:endonuclease/exonuclease/phosphatase family protein [Flavobacterium sp.]|uniref:endonuclease/exonuclease/phosphatase family protein n=1 Tax=Flavobacterium sp. TaxID=239 RepID=UPI0039E690B8